MAKRQIYWDTSVFLCFLNKGEEDRRKICEDILQHAKLDEIEIYTSTFTITEVIRPKAKSIPSARRLTADEILKIRGMFRWPFIIPIELDERIAQFAVDLARDHGLMPADAVHSASAILWKVDALQAWDRDFSSIGKMVRIECPTYLSAQRPLDGMEPPPIGPRPELFEEDETTKIIEEPLRRQQKPTDEKEKEPRESIAPPASNTRALLDLLEQERATELPPGKPTALPFQV